MTAFDDRKTAAEAKFTHDQEFENGGDKLVHGSGGISQPRAE